MCWGRERPLMGAGNVVTEYDAGPWLVRIMRHTGNKLGWRYMHRVDFDTIKYDPTPRQRQLVGT